MRPAPATGRPKTRHLRRGAGPILGLARWGRRHAPPGFSPAQATKAPPGLSERSSPRSGSGELAQVENPLRAAGNASAPNAHGYYLGCVSTQSARRGTDAESQLPEAGSRGAPKICSRSSGFFDSAVEAATHSCPWSAHARWRSCCRIFFSLAAIRLPIGFRLPFPTLAPPFSGIPPEFGNFSASPRYWNPSTASSAYRTTITSPRATFFRHACTH